MDVGMVPVVGMNTFGPLACAGVQREVEGAKETWCERFYRPMHLWVERRRGQFKLITNKLVESNKSGRFTIQSSSISFKSFLTIKKNN